MNAEMSQPALTLRRANREEAAELAQFAARTFQETFGADNRPVDVAAHLASCYGVERQRAPFTTRLPLGEPTVLSALTFLVQHESYHIGQVTFLRKHAGLPAMQYA